MNTKDNIVYKKSKSFAFEIIKLYKYLTDIKNESVLSKQILRSGTSIGANLAESEFASSEKDFLNKLYIALKECNETLYWLDLIYESEYIETETYNSLINQCDEIKRILSSSTKTIKERLKNQNNNN
ncbi:MAG: four helix bundle protein [Eubacterium sp.]|nr:four helix bundle protein [Eubacterium sp.]